LGGAWWQILTLEELRGLSDHEVARRVNNVLAPQGPGIANQIWRQPADFIAAQFYVAELDRRESQRFEEKRDRTERTRFRVDLAIEVLIILLIGLELVMALKQDREQTRAFQAQQAVWSNMEKSLDATAGTLAALQKTTETMNTAVQNELALSYDPSVGVSFDPAQQMRVVNTGRTNLMLGGSKIANQPAVFLGTPYLLGPTAGYAFNAGDLFGELTRSLKPFSRGPSIACEVYIKNELGVEFVVNSTITPVSDTLGTRLVTQVNGISRRDWPKR